MFLVGLGTALAAIHFLSCVRIAESVTLPTGAFALITFVPISFPSPIAWPGTLYSLSCPIAGPTKMVAKNLFKLFIIGFELGAVPQSLPQKTVNTVTFLSRGPPL